MKTKILDEVRSILSAYIDVPLEVVSMEADLDLEYDMDSTEMTELAKTIEQKFSISVHKSARQNWVTGNDISRFVLSKLSPQLNSR